MRKTVLATGRVCEKVTLLDSERSGDVRLGCRDYRSANHPHSALGNLSPNAYGAWAWACGWGTGGGMAFRGMRLTGIHPCR